MASKGQKFKKASPETKREILKKYFDDGYSTVELGREYGISHKTIQTWVYKSNRGMDVTVDHWKGNSGRKKSENPTMEDYKERYEILKKYQAFLEARQGKK